MSTRSSHYLILLAAAGLVFFTNLGGPGLWDEDEPKNATCAQEMFVRGDWVVPTFNDELRTDKPILIYWLLLSVYHLLGISELTARLPSAVLSAGTVLLTYEIGRSVARPAVGLWGAVVLTGSLMFDVAARACTPDGTLIFCTTLGLCLFVKAVESRLNRVSGGSDTSWPAFTLTWWQWLLIDSALALAVLAKGPTGVLLPIAVIGLFHLVWRALWSDPWQTPASYLGCRERAGYWLRALSPVRIAVEGWRMQPWWIVVTLLAIALPWYWLVGVRTEGAWLAGFLGKHNVERFLQPMEGHSGPPVYYPIAIFIGMFPWSLLFPAALWRVGARIAGGSRSNWGDVLLLSWVTVYLTVFTLARTKLPSYVLPCYPALAILLGRVLVEECEQLSAAPSRWLQAIYRATAVGGLLFAVGLPIAAAYVLPGESPLLGLIGLLLTAGGVIALAVSRRGQPTVALGSFAAAMLLFGASLFGGVSLAVDRHQNSERLVQLMRQHSGSDYDVRTLDFFRPSLVFYARKPVREVTSLAEAREYLAASPDHYLVTRDDQWPALQPVLPEHVEILSEQRMFLRRRHDVLLLGTRRVFPPPPSATRQAASPIAEPK